MFLVDKKSNEAITLKKCTFGELNFHERQNLQEWISKNPLILGEDLLIIQKEFSGFSDTNERLDLLAIDKFGSLVVIENKLDDSGKDVVWQALKYVSYCATLSKSEVRDIYSRYANKAVDEAEDDLAEFLQAASFEDTEVNSTDQRIILVSAAFRKEVTSTVMWLMDHGINIRCIKVTPYLHGEDVFLDTEQVLPTPDTEELQIKLSSKKKEETLSKEAQSTRYKVRFQFWTQALPEIQKQSDVLLNRSPTEYHWLGGPSGYAGLRYNVSITQNSAQAELYIDTGTVSENKAIFDALYRKYEEIDQIYGVPLEWERLEHRRASRVVIRHHDFLLKDESTWPDTIDFLAVHTAKLKSVLNGPIQEALLEVEKMGQQSERN